GGAADIVDRVMVAAMNKLDNEDCRLLLQVHDALVFEVREDLAEEYSGRIQTLMEDVNGICNPGSDEPLFPVRFAVEVSYWDEKAVKPEPVKEPDSPELEAVKLKKEVQRLKDELFEATYVDTPYL